MKVCRAALGLGVEVLLSYIAGTNRIQSFRKIRTTLWLVKFCGCGEIVKEALLTKFREARNTSTNFTDDIINNSFPNEKVNVNDHLSPTTAPCQAEENMPRSRMHYFLALKRKVFSEKGSQRKSESDKLIKLRTSVL